MKKHLIAAALALCLTGEGTWAQTPGFPDGHTRKHSSKRHAKKGKHKGKKARHPKGNGAELESQIRDKDVQFNARASLK